MSLYAVVEITNEIVIELSEDELKRSNLADLHGSELEEAIIDLAYEGVSSWDVVDTKVVTLVRD